MGRKKIKIESIGNERQKQVTLSRRRAGLLKKAHELAVLCDCNIMVLIYDQSDSCHVYASDNDPDGLMLKYQQSKVLADTQARQTPFIKNYSVPANGDSDQPTFACSPMSGVSEFSEYDDDEDVDGDGDDEDEDEEEMVSRSDINQGFNCLEALNVAATALTMNKTPQMMTVGGGLKGGNGNNPNGNTMTSRRTTCQQVNRGGRRNDQGGSNNNTVCSSIPVSIPSSPCLSRKRHLNNSTSLQANITQFFDQSTSLNTSTSVPNQFPDLIFNPDDLFNTLPSDSPEPQLDLLQADFGVGNVVDVSMLGTVDRWRIANGIEFSRITVQDHNSNNNIEASNNNHDNIDINNNHNTSHNDNGLVKNSVVNMAASHFNDSLSDLFWQTARNTCIDPTNITSNTVHNLSINEVPRAILSIPTQNTNNQNSLMVNTRLTNVPALFNTSATQIGDLSHWLHDFGVN